MALPEQAAADQAAEDANEAHRDSTDENPSNGQDAPVSSEDGDRDA